MDEEIRGLERLAAQGDPRAIANLEWLRQRAGLCPLHGLPAEDPAGWGAGCPTCEEEIWCSTGNCGLKTCHRCNPEFNCEYGHETCYELQDEMMHPEDEEEDYEEEEPDEYGCSSCQGTGIGYPVDRSCSSCGGSGIARRSRDDYDGDYGYEYEDDYPYDY